MRSSSRRSSTHFNPLPSCEGRLLAWRFFCADGKFQSTPLMRGETKGRFSGVVRLTISIHSPHARGDARRGKGGKPPRNISIHSPHARGDRRNGRYPADRSISIHSPHARGDTYRMEFRRYRDISIHSPHARGDSVSLQKSIRIYVSLHNKTMIHRFSGLYKPLFAAQSPISGVRSA